MSIAILFTNKEAESWRQYIQDKHPGTRVEIYPDISDPASVEYVICWKPEAGAIAEYPNLKVIQSAGAGVDHIDHVPHGVTLCRIVDHKLSHDMYEFVLMVMLADMKNMNIYRDEQRQRVWQPRPYRSIDGTRVGILGIGQIGSYVGQHLAQLGFSVSGWSRSAKMLDGITCYHGERGMHEMMGQVDYLINLLPLTDETRDILNKKNLSSLPRGAYLINVGRGPSHVDADLIELLDSGHLSGVFLDVFRQEPLPEDHPFWHQAGLHMAPHVASVSDIDAVMETIMHNYDHRDQQSQLRYVIDTNKGY